MIDKDKFKPILILGTGRCGSSIFYDVFANHPQLAYISNLNVKFPGLYFVDKLNVARGKYLLRKGLSTPSEAYPLLNEVFPGYGHPVRNLTSKDVTNKIREEFRDIFYTRMKRQKKNQLLYKYTGWSRVGFFKEIFPEAVFIHFVRDGRAVANSLTQVTWWDGWQGPQNWRLGSLTQGISERMGRS